MTISVGSSECINNNSNEDLINVIKNWKHIKNVLYCTLGMLVFLIFYTCVKHYKIQIKCCISCEKKRNIKEHPRWERSIPVHISDPVSKTIPRPVAQPRSSNEIVFHLLYIK